MFDPLESRRLLAATLTSARLDAETGKVVLVGSSDADLIQIARFGKRQAQVIDGGDVVLTFNLSDAKVVSFAGNDGADYLSMGRVPLPLYASGGNDADAISGSRAGNFSDTLLGDSANDYLFGGSGDDTLVGGGGDDQLLGDEGNDTLRVLSDSSGDDSVLGGPGNDTVDCTDYSRGITLSIGARDPAVLSVDDRIYGQVEVLLGTGFSDRINNISGDPLTVFLGRGNDRYTGGSENETVYGGRGDDTINTAGGNDTIIDTEGVNSLDGGSGDNDLINDVLENASDNA